MKNAGVIRTDVNQYHKLFQEHLQEPYFVIDATSSELLFTNESICNVLDYKSQELSAMRLPDIFTPASLEKFSAALAHSNGNIFTLEVEIVPGNKTKIPFELTGIKISTDKRNRPLILCLLHEISAQSKMLRKKDYDQKIKMYTELSEQHNDVIRELEERNQYILKFNEALTKSLSDKILQLWRLNDAEKIADVGSWEWNIQTGIMWWSEQLYTMFEVDPQTYKPEKETLEMFIHPEDRDLYKRSLQSCLDSGESWNCDFRIVLNDEKIKFCNASGRVYLDDKGAPSFLRGTLRDVSLFKKTEESLIKLYESIKYIIKQTSQKTGIEYFESMTLALCNTLDADYSHIGVLQSDRQTIKTIALGSKNEILPGITYYLHGTPCETVVNKLTACYQKDVTLLFPDVQLLKDMHVEGYLGIPLYFKSGDPLGLIVCLFSKPIENSLLSETIISLFSDRAVNEFERMRDKEQLIQALKKAEESDRLKTAFLQNMSHEIRTPMNAIMGFADLLLENLTNKDRLKQFSKIIQKRSEDLLELINDILDLARIESGEQAAHNEAFDINRLFYELDELFQVYKEKMNKNTVQLNFHYCDPVKSTLLTDAGKLRQILINLINNAIKFTDNGRVDVGCSFSSVNSIEFYVEDTGTGIPLDKQDMIFRRFVQLENAGGRKKGGTGLGLAIVKGLVEQLGGEIRVKSVEGSGSRFTFSIKYQPVAITVSSSIEDGTYNISVFKNKNLLIVEDDEYSTLYITELLGNSGFMIQHVTSGREAIKMVAMDKIDIILLDIQLPEMDGYEVASKVKSISPLTRIIAQTAYAMKEDKSKALEAGCDDYVSKPINKNELLNKIYAQLTHG